MFKRLGLMKERAQDPLFIFFIVFPLVACMTAARRWVPVSFKGKLVALHTRGGKNSKDCFLLYHSIDFSGLAKCDCCSSQERTAFKCAKKQKLVAKMG